MAKVIGLGMFFVILLFAKDNTEALSPELNEVFKKILIVCKQIESHGNWSDPLTNKADFLLNSVKERKTMDKNCTEKLTSYGEEIKNKKIWLELKFLDIFKAANEAKAWIEGVQKLEQINKKALDQYENALVMEGQRRLEDIIYYHNIRLQSEVIPLISAIMDISSDDYRTIYFCLHQIDNI